MSGKKDDNTPPVGSKYGMFWGSEGPRKEMPSTNDLSKFDIILSKIEIVSDTTKTIVLTLNKFADELYNPETGVYSRLKDNENKQKLNQKDIEEIQKTVEESNDKFTDELTELKSELKKELDPLPELIKWKDKINKSAIWIASGLGTTLIGLIAKLLYDYIAMKHSLPQLPK